MKWTYSKETLVPVISGALFILLFGLTVVGLLMHARKSTGSIIAKDIQTLLSIFTKIHAACSIEGFKNQQTYINFLNVGTFSGSEVGGMNVAHPSRWEGPYVHDNPTIQEKEYMIISTNKGLFITPGNGVKLPNGMIVGKDIIFDEHSNVPNLIESGDLQHKNKPLAVALSLTTHVSVSPETYEGDTE